jgi:hypothetical protein
MNEAPRIRDIKERVAGYAGDLRILALELKGSRAEERVHSAITLLENAWEELLVAERLIK